MDIPLPKKQEPEISEHDACFHLKSQQLISSNSPMRPPYRLSFKRSFEPILALTLLKKTLNTSWSERHFLLTSTRLLYFSDSSMKELKGCFVLASLILHGLDIHFAQPEIQFTVQAGAQYGHEKTLLVLKIENKNAFKEWEYELRRVITRLQGLSFEDLGLFPHIKDEHLMESHSKLGRSEGNFWNRLLISQQELLKYGSHMDILLLRSKNPIFYFHRFFMRSHYDHVGVLIKDQTERLFLLEAIQSKGVCLSSLDSILLTFHEEYQQIAYRKLISNGKQFHVEQLENYINVILGSKYELSLSKLLLDNVSVGSDGSEQSEKKSEKPQKKQKTYFCSQLVADIYLRFGILAEGKSNSFWPKDFEDQQMILSKDFRLSSIMQVQLEELPDSSDVSST